MAKLEHLGADRYRIRVYDGVKGRQVQESFRAKTRAEAKAKGARVEAGLRDRLRQERDRRGTVAGLVDDYRAENDPTASPSTVYRRNAILDRVKADLGHHRLVDLSARHVDHWLNELRAEDVSPSKKQPHVPRHRSEATIHHYYRQLAAVLNQGVAWDDIDRAVTKHAKTPKMMRHEVEVPDASVVAELVNAAPWPLRTIAMFAARTGLRRGEICGLRWSDLSPAGDLRVMRAVSEVPGKPLVLKPPKTRQTRTVTLDDGTVTLLAQHRVTLEAAAREGDVELVADGPMFPSPAAEHRDGSVLLSPDAVSRAWRSHCRRHGVHVRFHDLRHVHASALLNDGQPLSAVSRRLGHSLPSTTQNIYGHASSGADRVLAERAAELLP